MDAFEGTWTGTQTCGESKGFDSFCKAMNTDAKLIDAFRKATVGMTYSKKDTQWQGSVLVDGEVKKTTDFVPGTEFETVGLDGKNYKVVITMDGCELAEKAVPTDGSSKGTTTTRSIKDGVMTVKSTKNDDSSVTMEYTMTKK